YGARSAWNTASEPRAMSAATTIVFRRSVATTRSRSGAQRRSVAISGPVLPPQSQVALRI
ncbi:MAG TPA: hypothetical protein VN842_03165, partial [Thermoplasmata archaeon]|nr:hypothetical protein [Thermoplasmata archaeon]